MINMSNAQNKYLRKTVYFSKGNEDLYQEVIGMKDASGYICDLIRKDLEGEKVDSTELVLSSISEHIVRECGIADIMRELRELRAAVENLANVNRQPQQALDIASVMAEAISSAVSVGMQQRTQEPVAYQQPIQTNQQPVYVESINAPINEPSLQSYEEQKPTVSMTSTSSQSVVASGGKRLNMNNKKSKFGKNALNKM